MLIANRVQRRALIVGGECYDYGINKLNKRWFINCPYMSFAVLGDVFLETLADFISKEPYANNK